MKKDVHKQQAVSPFSEMTFVAKTKSVLDANKGKNRYKRLAAIKRFITITTC
ncbi:hypothetical protein MUB16_20095 [Priestia sp. OVL9]|nr:hypothetical protein [Priestia sp. OVL9]